MRVFGFLTSILGQKCPKCREGHLFSHAPYNIKKFTEMNEKCSYCGQKFRFEPSFYDGAMYVSYALQVALFVTVLVAFQIVYPQARVMARFSTVASLAILLIPMIYRLSRTIWIHFFVKYDRSKSASKSPKVNGA